MYRCKQPNCNKEFETIISRVKNNHTKSCGCLRKKCQGRDKTHGMTKSSAYRIWCGIKKRCYNENNKDFLNYGGRGIKVCDRWKCSFENFYKDMWPRPSTKHSIDRIEGDKDYAPDNCKWSTSKEQNCNRKDNIHITINGETKVLKEWAKIKGINYQTVYSRIFYSNWSVENALSLPNQKIKRKNGK